MCLSCGSISRDDKLKFIGHLSDTVHQEEAAGDLAFGLLLFSCSFAIGDRRVTNALAKEAAKASETLKSNFEADVSNAQVVGNQELFGFFDTTFD